MNLLRVDPSRELEEMSERFSRLIGRMPARQENGKEMMAVADWNLCSGCQRRRQRICHQSRNT